MLRPLTLLCLGLGACLCLAAPRPAAAEGVAVLKSDDLGPYDRFVTGFSVELQRQPRVYVLKGDEEAVLAELRAGAPELVLALGPKAATLAMRRLPETPILFALVPNWQRYGLSGRNVAGIALSRSVARDLETLQAIVPGLGRLGVFFDPRYSKTLIREIRRASEAQGVKLVAVQVSGPEEVARSLRRLEGKVDALWMIPDRTVADVRAFQAVRDFALGKGLPVLALTSTQVREGALLALAPNYGRLGRQAAQIARRILAGTPAGEIGVREPEGLDLVVNLTAARRVARRSGGGDLAWALLEHAAKRGLTVRVYE